MDFRDIVSLVSVATTLIMLAFFLGSFKSAYVKKDEVADLERRFAAFKQEVTISVAGLIGRAEFDKRMDTILNKIDEMNKNMLDFFHKGAK